MRGSAERLAPVVAELAGTSSLPGWQLRIVDGNHLAATEKRLKPLRNQRGAALPGHALVVYDPDRDQVVDLQACEDAYASERVGVLPLLASAGPRAIVDSGSAFLHPNDSPGISGGAGWVHRASAQQASTDCPGERLG